MRPLSESATGGWTSNSSKSLHRSSVITSLTRECQPLLGRQPREGRPVHGARVFEKGPFQNAIANVLILLTC